jgi:hypothetical protein
MSEKNEPSANWPAVSMPPLIGFGMPAWWWKAGQAVQPHSGVDNSDISPTRLTSLSRLLILPSQKETVPLPHFKPRGF